MEIPVSVVELVPEEGMSNMHLKKEALREVLERAGDRKLAFLSIVGPVSTGKSMFLSLLVRYLKSLEKDGRDGEGSDWLFPEDKAPLEGFPFENSMDAVTSGIQIWPKPFPVGEDLALFLIDTPGFYARETSLREWGGMVGSMLLLSSCTIFNVIKNLQEDSLASLNTFLEFAKLIASDSEVGDGGSKFQKVVFLVRDWNNPSEFSYGCGRDFLDKRLAIDSGVLSPEAVQVRDSLISSVEELQCFLLPRPENTNIEFGKPLCPSSLGEPFAAYLRQFMTDFINPAQIKSKIVHGLPLTTSKFLEMLEGNLKNFNHKFTTLSNLTEVSVQMQMELSILKSVKFYKSTMTRKFGKKSIPRPSHADKFHADLKPHILGSFQTDNGSKFKPEVISEYLASLARQLDSCFGELQQQVRKNLLNSMSEAESEALEAVRSQMAQLTLSERGSPSTFRNRFDGAMSTAKEVAKQKFKSVEEDFREHLEQSLNHSFENLFEELQKQNQSEITAVLLENERALEEARIIYSSKIELVVDLDDGHIPFEKLERFHKSAVAAAQKFLLKGTTIPESAVEIREMLVKLLDDSVVEEYSQLKQKNQDALHLEQKSLEDITNKAMVQMESEVSEILSRDVELALSLEKLKQVHSTTLKKVCSEFSDLSCNNKGISGNFEKALVEKLKDVVDRTRSQLEARALQQEMKETEAIENGHQNFIMKSADISAQFLDGEELELMLQKEAESQLTFCKEKLTKLGSNKISEHVNSLAESLRKETEKVVEANNTMIQRFESDLEDIANGTMADLNATLGTSNVNAEAISGEEDFKSEYMKSFNTRASHISLPQARIEKQRAKVEERIDAALESYSRRFAISKQDRINCSTESAVLNANWTFTDEMKKHCSNYTILDQKQYENKAEELKSSLLLKIERSPEWNLDTVQEVKNAVQEAVAGAMKSFWTETVVEKNHKAEGQIREDMSSFKKEFQEKIPTEEDREGLLNVMLVKFKKGFHCSSYDDQERYSNELEQDLYKILEETETKLQKSREVELASQKLIQEFTDEAPDLKGLDGLRKEKIKKFSEVAANFSQAEKFKKDIENTMQSILQQRREQEKKIKSLNSETEKLIKDFKATLKTKGSGNIDSLKMDFAERLTKEAKNLNIDAAEFLKRLNEAMETSYQDYEKQMKKKVMEVVDSIVRAYRDEMSGYFSSAVYFTPQELADKHAEATQKAFASSPKVKGDQEVEARLKKELDEAYEEFSNLNARNTPTSIAIGIDLGTTYSCVGWYSNGDVKIIPNDLGKKTTPSYVFFDESGEIVVGEAAKNQAHMYPERTVYEVKRLIGRNLDDPAIQGDLVKWPYKVVKEKGVLKVQIGDSHTYHPEEVSAEVLKKLKKCAEDYIGQEVEAAVITVPAYFTEGQKAATKRAGEAAGLTVLRILTEPTAAAIAYNLNWKEGQGSAKGLVYDLGGGTFDVAIFTATKGSIDIVNVGGDTHLGGVDLDNEMVTHCVQEFKSQSGVDLMEDKDSRDWKKKRLFNRNIMRLKRKCEQYKIDLTQADFVNVAIDNIHQGEDLLVRITRTQFEAMIATLIQKSLSTVEEVLTEAKMGKDDIDEVVLIGGSTRIPKVQERLRDFFGKALNKNINPDEAVAVGAAYEAAVLNGKRAQESGDIRSAAVAPRGMSIKDITPMSYGIEVQDGDMCILIPKQSKVPTEMSQTFTTHYNQQTSVLIVIYEGEDQKAMANTKVGEFFLNGIPPGLAGRHQVKVTMKVDFNGMITVSAVCLENGVQKNLTVRANRRGMTK